MDYIRQVVYTPDFAIYGILHDERRSNGGQFVVFYKTVYGILQHGEITAVFRNIHVSCRQHR